MNKESTEISIQNVLFLILLFAIYSLSGVFSKIASRYTFISPQYILCVCAIIGLLGFYAIMWQIVLKKIPLSKAYLFKSIGIIFSMIYAAFLFNEPFTINNIIGSSMIISGVSILSYKK